MTRLRGLTTLLALIAALAAGIPLSAEAFSPKSYRLGNGLELVVIPNHRAPIVQHMVWYRVGAIDEPPGKSGIAHFLEHLMFKGTEKIAPGDFSRIVAEHGGRDNAFTSQDYTGYVQQVAKENLPLVMELEADRMTNLELIDEEVIPELDVVLEERNSRVGNNPRAQFGEQLAAALYMNHPYNKPIIGWEHELTRLTRADAEAFYDRWYGPNNAIVVIAGDVEPDEVLRLAEETYGRVAPRDIPPRLYLSEPPQLAARRIEMSHPTVTLPSWQRQYLAPSYGTEMATDGAMRSPYALQVLSYILGGGATSRLYRKLVVQERIASSAGAYYGPSDIGPSVFGFYSSPLPGVEPAIVEEAIDAEIARLLAEGVTEEEVKRATDRLAAEAIYDRDSVTGAARLFGGALAIGRSVEDVIAWPERIQAVTPEEIAAAATDVLDLRRSVTGILTPEVAGNG